MQYFWSYHFKQHWMRRHRARGNIPQAIETKLASHRLRRPTSVGASSERRGAAPPPAMALEARRARSPRPARARASRRPPAEAAVGCRRTKAEKILFQNLTYLFFLPCRSFIIGAAVHFFGRPKITHTVQEYGCRPAAPPARAARDYWTDAAHTVHSQYERQLAGSVPAAHRRALAGSSP